LTLFQTYERLLSLPKEVIRHRKGLALNRRYSVRSQAEGELR